MQTRKALTGYLLDEIVAGRLAAGDKLPPERALATRFGLSRPIVREVLRSLAERGFVDIQPSRGTFVREASSADGSGPLDSSFRRRNATVRELLEARAMLEVHAASLAAVHASSEQIEGLRTCLDEFGPTCHVFELARLDRTFHALIVHAGQNIVIETMYASISGLSFELMLRVMSDPAVRDSGFPLHEAAWEAIRDRKPDRAGSAMGRLVDIAVRYFGPDIDRGVNDALPRTADLGLDG